MVNSVWFYNAEIFKYNGLKIIVRANLNNTKEYFAFDLENAFLGVLKPLDLENGVSVEVAKRAQKVFKKALKETKNTIADNREESESVYLKAVLENENNTNFEIQKVSNGEEFEMANNSLKVFENTEFNEKYKNEIRQKDKKIKNWEDFI